jgi:hypothetical protein
MFADEFLPVYDVSDEVATVVAAEPQVVWEALLGVGLVEVGKRTPLAGLLGVLLGERPDEELALGLVGKFWRPVIECTHVLAERFRDFDEPGYAKTIYALSDRPLADGRSLLSGLMRTATTDEHARRWFRRYWTFGVGSSAHILVHALLETIRQTAEVARTTTAEQAR